MRDASRAYSAFESVGGDVVGVFRGAFRSELSSRYDASAGESVRTFVRGCVLRFSTDSFGAACVTHAVHTVLRFERPPECVARLLCADDSSFRSFVVDKYAANSRDEFMSFCVDVLVEGSLLKPEELLRCARSHDGALRSACAQLDVRVLIDAFRDTPEQARRLSECMLSEAKSDDETLRALYALEQTTHTRVVPDIIKRRVEAALTPELARTLADVSTAEEAAAVARKLPPTAVAAILAKQEYSQNDALLEEIARIFPLYAEDVARAVLGRKRAGDADAVLNALLSHEVGFDAVSRVLLDASVSVMRNRRVEALKSVLTTVGRPWGDAITVGMEALGKTEGAAEASKLANIKFE